MPLSKNALIGIIAGGGVAATATVVVVVLVVFSGPHEQFEYTPVGLEGKEDPVSLDVANKVIYGSDNDGMLGPVDFWFYDGKMIMKPDGDDTCARFSDEDLKSVMEFSIDYALPTDDAEKKDSKKVGDVECDVYEVIDEVELVGEKFKFFKSWCVADRFVHEELSHLVDDPDNKEEYVYVDHESLSKNDDRFDPDNKCKKYEDIEETGATMFSTRALALKKKMVAKFAKVVKSA
ncbi:hypothetical protein P9112_000588 [Eukaryota sp. TZLM1-RC]